jgi:hypothetical protein
LENLRNRRNLRFPPGLILRQRHTPRPLLAPFAALRVESGRAHLLGVLDGVPARIPNGILWWGRRFLADATAVQLTRNPDGLARALQKADAGGERGKKAADYPFSIAQSLSEGGFALADGLVFSRGAPLDGRIHRLVRLGATSIGQVG